jgi:hypothetical protein
MLELNKIRDLNYCLLLQISRSPRLNIPCHSIPGQPVYSVIKSVTLNFSELNLYKGVIQIRFNNLRMVQRQDLVASPQGLAPWKRKVFFK